jgi:hypothetical protein
MKEKTQAWAQLDSDKICFTFKTCCNVFYIPKHDYKCDFVSNVLDLLNNVSDKKYYLTYFSQDSRCFVIESEVMDTSFDFLVPDCDENGIEELLSILNSVHDVEMEFEAKPKFMNFLQALDELGRGKKVRRKAWTDKVFFTLKNCQIFNIVLEDLQAKDWVVYESN